jgi:hypothetical protein
MWTWDILLNLFLFLGCPANQPPLAEKVVTQSLENHWEEKEKPKEWNSLRYVGINSLYWYPKQGKAQSGWSFVYTIQRLWFTSWWYTYSNWFLIYLIISGLTTRRLLQVTKYILGKGSRLHKNSQNWLPLRKTTKNYVHKENQTSRLCNTVQTGYYIFQYTRRDLLS